MKRSQNAPVIFINRDGAIIKEFEKYTPSSYWKKGVFAGLSKIEKYGSYETVLYSHWQKFTDANLPGENYREQQNNILVTLSGENINFDDVIIDFSRESKEGNEDFLSLFKVYTGDNYDLSHSYVIGSGTEDMQLAHHLGVKCLLFSTEDEVEKIVAVHPELDGVVTLTTGLWSDITQLLVGHEQRPDRTAQVERKTKETQITLSVNLDGTGQGRIKTGISFFDHMLEQVIRHSGIDMNLSAEGDLEVDEHHTVEDIAICMGLAIKQALGDKRGISRYGFDLLPMDEVLAECAIDFSGRPYFNWDVPLQREYIGTFATEMFPHFFKSFSDAAACNLDLKVNEGNSHHMIEAIFKCFSKSVKMAVHRYPNNNDLPSTKGVL